jgi:hypothetical protein
MHLTNPTARPSSSGDPSPRSPFNSLLASLLLLLAPALPLCAEPPVELPVAANTPRISSPAPIFNFGEQDEAVPIEHTFVLKNIGTAPLVINAIRTSCGCTTAQPATNVVPPGGETTLKADLSLAGRRGLQSKSITVESNDPAQPAYVLLLNGTAVAELALEPPFITFGNVTADAKAERTVYLLSRRPNVQITNVVCESSSFQAEILPPTPGQPPTIRVTTVPPMATGQARGLIRVQTTHPQRKEVSASAMAIILPEVRMLPDEVIVHGEPGAVSPRIALLMIPGSVREYQITAIEPPSTNTVVQFKNTAPGTYRIDLLNVPTGPEANGTRLVIHTSLTKMKDIVIPFRHVPGG